MTNLTIPHYIPSSSIPIYVEDYLTQMSRPNVITSSFLSQVCNELLLNKQQYIELNFGKRRALPDRLDFDEVACVLVTLFTFRNIRMSSTQMTSLLGIYVNQGPQQGIYQTSRKDMYRLIEPLAPKFRNRDMDDVLDKIERLVPVVELSTQPHLSPVNNGIFNKETNELMPFNEA